MKSRSKSDLLIAVIIAVAAVAFGIYASEKDMVVIDGPDGMSCYKISPNSTFWKRKYRQVPCDEQTIKDLDEAKWLDGSKFRAVPSGGG